jgi:phasin family protein
MANPRQESQSTSQVGQEARRMADESARAGRKTVETGERIARVTGDATRAAADAGERATRVGADLFEQNADAVQQIWYSGMDIASELAERSTAQFARAMGLSGDQAQHAADQSSRNFDAMMQSARLCGEGLQSISREWFDFTRRCTEENLQQLNALARSRTPQELVAAQTELFRDNLEKLLESSRRIAETSARVAGEAGRKITENIERQRHAA